MRIMALAITSALVVCAAMPASAKSRMSQKMVDSFEVCEAKAAAQGLVHGQAGHRDFVAECMGARPTNIGTSR
jgi:hypothetical protein